MTNEKIDTTVRYAFIDSILTEINCHKTVTSCNK